MCICTPNIRRPYCGIGHCKPQHIIDAIQNYGSNLEFQNEQLVQHIKSGEYYKIVEAYARREDDLVHVVVYRKQSTGEVWVRPYMEFKQKFQAVQM